MKADLIGDAEDHITDAAVAASATNVVTAGSVLAVTRSGILRRTFPIAVATSAVAINQDLKALTPANGIYPRYVALYLQRDEQSILHDCTKDGTTVDSIDFPAFLQRRIPIAPAPEQDRIVAAIEEQFSRLDAGVAALERVRQNLKRLRASVLQAAVTGQLVPHSVNEDVSSTLERISSERRVRWQASMKKPYREPAPPADFAISIPGHWRIASLEVITDAIRVICYGILMPKEHIENGIPYVRVKDMRGWAIDVEGLRRTSFDIAAKYARASLAAGDLLLAIRGSYGRVAIIPPELDGANITQDSARIATHPAIDHRYLLYYLGGTVANRYYSQVARGVAVKGVNIGDLRSMPVPIPPRQEQVAIADEVERQFTLLDNAEAAVQHHIRQSQSLRSSILATAFSGRLVPQDPTDEPASLLLERIAVERASSNGHKPKRGRKARAMREEVTA